MINFSKNTRFKQLPDDIKQRLLILYNKTKQRKDIKTMDIDTSTFTRLSTKLSNVHSYEQQKNYSLLANAAEHYKNDCGKKECVAEGK